MLTLFWLIQKEEWIRGREKGKRKENKRGGNGNWERWKERGGGECRGRGEEKRNRWRRRKVTQFNLEVQYRPAFKI